MNSSYRREELYLEQDTRIGQDALNAIKSAIANNHAVGTMVGYYDDQLTFLSVSDYLLDNLNYRPEEFYAFAKGSLKNICCGKSLCWLEPEQLRKMQGALEGQMITGDGTPVDVQVYKADANDADGRPVWILAVRVDWEYENYILINEAIQSGPWYMDCGRDGTILRVNWSDTFRVMLGYHDVVDFPDVLESWSELLHPNDHDRVVSRLHEAIRDTSNQTKYHVDYQLKRADGSYHWYRAIGEIIRRRDGSARRIAGIFINIDQEKAALMQIQRSNAFHQAFTKANLCEYYVDLQNNSFESLKVEPSLMSIFEQSYTWDELISAFVENYVCADDKISVKTFYDRKNMEEKLSSVDSEQSLECQILLNGQQRWIRNVIMRGELEGTQYAIIFLRDITEAREEEEKRQKMLDDNSAMAHLIHSMIHVVDHFAICDLKYDRYEYYNINIEQKYPPKGSYSNFAGMVTERFKTLEKQECLAVCLSTEHLRRQIRQESDSYKFEYCSMDEKEFRMASFVPIEWEQGTLTKVLWISMDISAEKRVEMESRKALKDAFRAADRASKAKTEFLSNMSHDIRTPMNAIVGLTALAGANIENQERVTNCLGKITKSSRHLLRLINEVLDMARIESGKISLTDEEFGLSDLVDNLIFMITPDIEEHGHHLKVNVEHLEHEAVCGDSLRIQQVFLNLMGNAVKYTPDGGNISLTIEEKPNGFSELGCFTFCIEDDGIGMSEEFQQIMFQPFTRADDNRTTNIHGTGLGMAIARNIVHMMNGEIEVESKEGEGTKVTITIYLKLQEKESVMIDELTDLPVLVVDDEVSCCESTVAALEEIGIAGEWVTSGEEAVERTVQRHNRQDDYFAIIMDWHMPGMDGLETTRQIRKFAGSEVTIIVLTAYDYSEIEEEARAAGVDAFIAKPLFPSRLTATLKMLVSGQAERENQSRDYLSEIAKRDYSGKRILLVEDNDLNREIAAEIIHMSGAQVECASNGREAVEKIAFSQENQYDLVFMDIQMPVMNGYEATAAIRSLPGRRGKLPIIATTANAFAEDVQLAKNTGMNEHIAKPLELNKLYEVLRQWLG